MSKSFLIFKTVFILSFHKAICGPLIMTSFHSLLVFYLYFHSWRQFVLKLFILFLKRLGGTVSSCGQERKHNEDDYKDEEQGTKYMTYSLFAKLLLSSLCIFSKLKLYIHFEKRKHRHQRVQETSCVTLIKWKSYIWNLVCWP